MTLPKKPFPFQLLIATAAVVIGLSAGAIALTIRHLYEDTIRTAERETRSTALLVADQLVRSIEPVDKLLTELRDVVPELGITTPGEFERFFGSQQMVNFLHERRIRVPTAKVIGIFAADGAVVQSSQPLTSETLRGGRHGVLSPPDPTRFPGLFVSAPVLAGSPDQRMIYLSRRITGAYGDLVGIVAVGVAIDYFDRIYDAFSALNGQSFVVARQDGTVLANRPILTGLDARMIAAESPWHRLAAAGGGTFRADDLADQDPRYITVHPVTDTPFVVGAAILERTALAEWRNRAIQIGTGTLLAMLCSLWLLWALNRQFGRVVASETSLAERETRLQEKSAELEQVNMRLDAALNNMSHGLCMFDRDGRLLVCNDRYRRMYRLSYDTARPGITLPELMRARVDAGTFSGDPDTYVAEVRRTSQGLRPGQFTAELTDGRIIAVLNDPMPNGGFVSVHEDITERSRAEMRIAHMARHDPLTEIANRLLFRERMGEALDRLERTGKGFAAFIFDIDLFKSVNDSLGHGAGDTLLRAVAHRLQRCVKDTDTVGRIGGDEFAVLQIAEDQTRVAATALATRLLEEIRAPYEIDGERIVIGISIGVAIAPEDGTEPSQILKNADLALYRAKADGRGCYRFFEPEMDANVRQRREFEFQLREALIRQEFEIHYQPIVDIATYRPCAVEALVRWRHPQLGVIPPDKFIPVAEEIGLIIPLGEWILNAACSTAAAWPDHVRLAVNLSAVQFRSGDLVDVVRRAIAGSGLPAARLELEITESVLLQKNNGGLAVLHDLAALGVHIVLDDFGTGYSSLSYLQMFPFSKIKIDKSFVADLSSRSDCAAIVCTVMNLAKALDMGTTAEGVETWEQVSLLRAAGCREAQGYLFGRPGPAAALSFESRETEIPGVAA